MTSMEEYIKSLFDDLVKSKSGKDTAFVMSKIDQAVMMNNSIAKSLDSGYKPAEKEDGIAEVFDDPDDWTDKTVVCMNNYKYEKNFEYLVEYLCVKGNLNLVDAGEPLIVVMDMNGNETLVERVQFKLKGHYF